MKPKFSPGDLVWARAARTAMGVQRGEYAGIIHKLCDQTCGWSKQHGNGHTQPYWQVFDIPIPTGKNIACVAERFLRPRRDDYQQREDLGSLEVIKLIRWASDNEVLVPAEPFDAKRFVSQVERLRAPKT